MERQRSDIFSRLRLQLAASVSAATVFALTGSFPLSAQAQEGSASLGTVLEEITVTARRREESLQDVPVAISVVTADFINQAGIRDQYDLFELTPGINYGQERDRNGARPGVRGVQAQNQNPLRQKVSVFIDGMPILTNIGSMQFVGLERIEVMRGPQSTAFGRATFGGALNYVTKDPGDTFASEFYAGTSNLGRDQLAINLDGPITDTLGFTAHVYADEYQGADEWRSSDGYRLGTQDTEFLMGKLKWTPSNRFDMEVSLYGLQTDDGAPIEPFLSSEARDACMNFTLPNGRPYINGEFNCDVSSMTPSAGVPLNHHPEAAVEQNADPLLYYWALANSVLDTDFSPGAYVDRDRIQAEFNFNTEGGSTLQILTSYQEEISQRWFDNDRSGLPAEIQVVTMMGMTAASLVNVATMSGPRENKEKYVDIRWMSPGENSVRWLIGASWYDYESISRDWRGYAGYLLGLEDEFQAAWLADPRTSSTPFNSADPWQFRSRDNDFTTNIGYYASLQWDVTDRTTLSFEGRDQEDDSTQFGENQTFRNVTTSFQPRIAITHALNDQWTLYGQYAQGTNPTGVNLPFTDPLTIASLQAANASGFISYDETTYLTFKEEEVTNLEFGIKGSALNNRLQLAAALYTMEWKDMIVGANFSWDGAWNDGSFDPQGRIFSTTGSGMVFINGGEGDLAGVEVEGSYLINDRWSLRGALTVSKNEYAELCDAATAIDEFGYAPTHTVAGDGVLFDCVEVAGNNITLVPDNKFSLSVSYDAPLGSSGWEWSARLGTVYQSKVYMDPLNLMWLPATTEYSGSLTFGNENWEIMLFGNNLTDDDTPRATVVLDPDPNICGFLSGCAEDNFWGSLRTPREVGLRLRYRL